MFTCNDRPKSHVVKHQRFKVTVIYRGWSWCVDQCVNSLLLMNKQWIRLTTGLWWANKLQQNCVFRIPSLVSKVETSTGKRGYNVRDHATAEDSWTLKHFLLQWCNMERKMEIFYWKLEREHALAGEGETSWYWWKIYVWHRIVTQVLGILTWQPKHGTSNR